MATVGVWNGMDKTVCVLDFNNKPIHLDQDRNTRYFDIHFSDTMSHPSTWQGYTLLTWVEFKERYNLTIEDIYLIHLRS